MNNHIRIINRRNAIASLGILGSTAFLTSCDKPNPADLDKSSPAKHWRYVKLDPRTVAENAYRIYPEGGCMYAVVGSVIHALADRIGEPFASFPVEMMRYGDGGMGGWGALCGVVNGGAALIGMFQSEKSKKRRSELIEDLCLWYERTALPHYKPAKPAWADNTQPSIAGSILCHVSVSNWSKASGCEAFSLEKKERCRRLSADGAMKIVEILNANFDNRFCPATFSRERKACIDCHGKNELGDSMGKMNCSSCHEFIGPHPSLQPNNKK